MLPRRALLLLAVAMLSLAPLAPANAAMICRVVADASSGSILHQEGDCETRVTPASTFKVPLAAMGFDAGILTDTRTPELPFKKGYADWGGAPWQRANDPTSWMKYSVVWYSQHISRQLGADKLAAYGRGFNYGNADFSGDRGKNNGLERSWISSSLKISPIEQIAFVRKLITGQLPISRSAAEKTISIMESSTTPAGWRVWGKTGSAYPRNADGSFNRSRGWGWYVGWTQSGERTLVFAHLAQDEKREKRTGGLRARENFLAEWDSLAQRLPR